jgi:hypothetical protein
VRRRLNRFGLIIFKHGAIGFEIPQNRVNPGHLDGNSTLLPHRGHFVMNQALSEIDNVNVAFVDFPPLVFGKEERGFAL